jgi:hypothetical protein
MFGTIFDKVQTLLSRTFWLGNFFPVLVFALLNLALAWIGIDGFSAWLALKWPDATVLSAVPAFGLIAVGILGFVLAPLIPVFRSALEGKILLPPPWREQLRAEFTAKAQELHASVRAAEAEFAFFDRLTTRAPDRFRAAREAQGARDDLNRATYERAMRAVGLLMDEVRRTQRTYDARLLPHDLVTAAVEGLEDALRQYPLDPGPANPVRDVAQALGRAQGEVQAAVRGARDIADRTLQGVEADFRTSYLPTDIRPTRMGNSRAAMEQYPSVAYLADFDFLWPRLRMVMSKNDTIRSAVETASAQLDFAVLMTVLAGATAIVWLVVLTLFGDSIVLYFAVGLFLPALTIFFYRLVEESQRAFGGVMEMAVDGLRFELLTALRQPLPPTLEAEQRTWRELQIALYSGLGVNVRFRHPKS